MALDVTECSSFKSDVDKIQTANSTFAGSSLATKRHKMFVRLFYGWYYIFVFSLCGVVFLSLRVVLCAFLESGVYVCAFCVFSI